MSDGTSYDAVEYPASLYSTTHPSHLAAIARLHGLDAPDPRTARVLEIAGGDGVNVIAMAAGLPDARFISFDLSRRAVARGAALVAASGLTNVRVEHGDLLALAETMEGPFDYVIAHGLYAWVPPPVQAAAMRLIGRVLSPEGVAFVSYNATPGGHLRRAIREMVLHGTADATSDAERMRRARDLLTAFATPRDGDRPILAAMREVAAPIARRHPGTLFHDELGEVYDPQSLTQVIAAAQAEGLAFLNDAIPAMVRDGLPGEGMDDAAVIAAAQMGDHAALAFFHQTLFVRPGRAPRRSLDPADLARLHATSLARRGAAGGFVIGDEEVDVTGNDRALLEALIDAAPARLPLAQVVTNPETAEAVIDLYRREAIALHAVPYPGTLEPGERPRANPVALAQIAHGGTHLYTLDHRVVGFTDPGPRAFLALLDGTRDLAAIAADWAASPYGAQIPADAALRELARAGMLLE